MKKILFLIIILGMLGVTGYMIYNAKIPESIKLTEEMQKQFSELDQSKFLSDPIYRIEFQVKQMTIQRRLIHAYLNEGHTTIARDLLESMILEEQQRQNFDLFGKKIPRDSGSLRTEAGYYEELAMIYEKLDDGESKEKALKKVIQLQQTAKEIQEQEDVARFKTKNKRKRALFD